MVCFSLSYKHIFCREFALMPVFCGSFLCLLYLAASRFRFRRRSPPPIPFVFLLHLPPLFLHTDRVTSPPEAGTAGVRLGGDGLTLSRGSSPGTCVHCDLDLFSFFLRLSLFSLFFPLFAFFSRSFSSSFCFFHLLLNYSLLFTFLLVVFAYLLSPLPFFFFFFNGRRSVSTIRPVFWHFIVSVLSATE